MKEYDVIVIGSGSGGIILDAAYREGLNVAYVDRGPLGGTCLNVGCIPSKMLIYPADRVVEIQEAHRLGIDAEIKNIDFQAIMARMRKPIDESLAHMRAGLQHAENLDFYEAEGYFTKDYTMEVAGEEIKGEKIFIVAGARPSIPPIKGLDEVDYLTNETMLQLTELPKSIVIIGGGYIAAEYGHFLAAMGSEVTMLQRGSRLVPNNEPEISLTLEKALSSRMTIHTNTSAVEVKRTAKGDTVIGKNQETGDLTEYTGERLLVATGRRSNADVLQVEKTGVKTDDRGFVIVNDYLETSKTSIWALGDVTGRYMFKHVANREAQIAWNNAINTNKQKMGYHAVPYAVFSYPQIAGVGLTQAEAAQKHDILVGTSRYSDVAKGEAMVEEDGFAKAIVDKATYKILGFHIIGPYAP
ncbi:MAG: dihydrolipoyl dehydrogenase, partial [Candidatus Hermodarchaeota archaeon]|nr:dihydrolipoyl dehydrogenase [Candidatus Hermodarchaeota archaeon]